MQEKIQIKMKILGVEQENNRALVSGQMVSGDVYDALYLTCQETGGKWDRGSRALLHSEVIESGFRLVRLQHVEGSKILEVGFTLVSE
jgi:hypothetical protein